MSSTNPNTIALIRPTLLALPSESNPNHQGPKKSFELWRTASHSILSVESSTTFITRPVEKDGLHHIHEADHGHDKDDPWAQLPKKYQTKKKSSYIRHHSDYKTVRKFSKFSLIVWKDWLTLRRNWKSTLIEGLTPILAVVILTIVVSNWPKINPKKYTNFTIQSNAAKVFKKCKRISFAPDIPLIKDLMDTVKTDFGPRFNFEIMEEKKILKKDHKDLCAAIVFNFDAGNVTKGIFPQKIKYAIRLSAMPRATSVSKHWSGLLAFKSLWHTERAYASSLITGPRNEDDKQGGSPGYYNEGFLFLQQVISEKIMHRIYMDGHVNDSNRQEEEDDYITHVQHFLPVMQRFPYPSFKNNRVVALIHDTLPLIIVLAYVIPFMLMVYGNVHEKEYGIRVHLKAVGIPISYHRFSWAIRCLILHVPAMAFITFVLSIDWSKSSLLDNKNIGAILTYTNPSLFFAFMVVYIVKVVTFVLLLSTFFNNGIAKLASICCGFLWIMTYIPYYYVKFTYNEFRFWQKLLCCTLSNTGIALGLHVIADGEARGVRKQWKDLFEGGIEQFSLGIIVSVMIFTSYVELVLARYISLVHPEKGLTPLPWNYFTKRWFWKNKLPPDPMGSVPKRLLKTKTQEERFPDKFESEGNIKRSRELQVEKLTKYYYNRDARGRLVLNRVNLNCYEGQCTIIIGQEGSGKSTLLSIIAGVTPSTSGLIVLSRQDLVKHRRAAMSFIGYCPGNNVAYPYLTVEETLELYCSLKCTGSKLTKWDEIDRFVKDANLEKYKDCIVNNLSESTKRVLMVASAYIGGSRAILLDDPMKDMDGTEKMEMWEFISRHKRHRTIVLAMESMNEGDFFVDKLVYMKGGETVCRGSVKFMQKNFGGGYHLHVLKAQPPAKECNVETITELISAYLGDNCVPYEDTKEQVNYFLPEAPMALRGLLDEMERRYKELGMTYFFSTFATLEEVIQNVSAVPVAPRMSTESKLSAVSTTASLAGFVEDEPVVPIASFKETCGRYFRRGLKYFALGFLIVGVPLMWIIIFVLYTQQKNEGPTEITFKPYKNTKVLISCDEAVHEGLYLCDSLKHILKTNYRKAALSKLYNNATIGEYILDHYQKYSTEAKAPVVGIEIRKSENSKTEKWGNDIISHFNNQPLHVPPLALSIVHDAILDYMMTYLVSKHPELKGTKEFPDYHIAVTNHPLPYTDADLKNFWNIFLTLGFFGGATVIVGFSVVLVVVVCRWSIARRRERKKQEALKYAAV